MPRQAVLPTPAVAAFPGPPAPRERADTPDLGDLAHLSDQSSCRWHRCARIISGFPGDVAVVPLSAPRERRAMKTYSPKASEITRAWHIIDAEGMVLGRLCTEAARVLRGKHKPMFAPHMDTGDHVVIVNADKVVMTSKEADHMVHRYSGYPGGLKSESYRQLLDRRPDEAIRRSVRGMLPKGPLGRQMVKKLKVYSGPEHPHAAQSPTVLEFPHAKAR
jgi:large subunit ribosomal protein L13